MMMMLISGGSGTRKPEKPTEISKTRTEPKPKIQIFEKPNRTETEITNRGYPIGNLSAFWKAYPRNVLNKNWSRLWKETANMW